ncbi:hypothetical protein QQ054_03940 [Oscillatoria amoena NRMC-F 0135]|nr:hypothetical protein [Oscillatoria amoena NRMC-F 0135]
MIIFTPVAIRLVAASVLFGLALAFGVRVSPSSAQFRRDRPDFFERGQEQLQQEIDRLQTQPIDPANGVLSVEAGAVQWQPTLLEEAGISILLPAGEQSQQRQTLETIQGAIEFQLLSVQAGNSRYLTGYALNLSPTQVQDPAQLLAAAGAAIESDPAVTRLSDRAIALGTYPGRELFLTSQNRQLVVRLYVVGQRMYLLSATQPLGTPSLTAATVQFFESFQLLN